MRWYVSVYIYYQLPIDTNFFPPINNQQTDENQFQAAKRRGEREAVDYKRRVYGYVFVSTRPSFVLISHDASLEKELERLNNRLERPASSMERTSPTVVDPSRK